MLGLWGRLVVIIIILELVVVLYLLVLMILLLYFFMFWVAIKFKVMFWGKFGIMFNKIMLVIFCCINFWVRVCFILLVLIMVIC